MFIVNRMTEGHQTFPAVASPRAGEAIVVWQGPASPHLTGHGVWSGKLARHGVVGDDALLNEGLTGYPGFYANVAANETGALAAWQALGDADGDGDAVFGRHLNGASAPAPGGPFLVNEAIAEYQDRPYVGAAADGPYIVVWTDGEFAAMPAELKARIYDSGGAAATDEFLVGDDLLHVDAATPVAALASDRFVIAWPRDTSSIVVRYFDDAGHVLGSLDLAGDWSVWPPSIGIANCRDGRHIVVWAGSTLTEEGPVAALLGQWLDDAMAPVGDTYTIATEGSEQSGTLSVTMTPDCNALVAVGPALFLTGAPASAGDESQTPTRLNATSSSAYYLPGHASIAADTPTTLVAVWSMRTQVAPPFVRDDIAAQWLCVQFDEGALCGDATCSGDADVAIPAQRVNVTDGLRTLNTATGLASCRACRCDTDSSGNITSSDAARILRSAVGQPVELTCPPCT